MVAPEWALDCLGTTVGKVVLAGPRALPSPPCVFVLCSFKPFWWFSCCHSDTKHLSLNCLGTTVGKVVLAGDRLVLPAVIHLILANKGGQWDKLSRLWSFKLEKLPQTMVVWKGSDFRNAQTHSGTCSNCCAIFAILILQDVNERNSG